MTRTRVNASLAALYGDIGKQVQSLVGKAGEMSTKVTGMMGAIMLGALKNSAGGVLTPAFMLTINSKTSPEISATD